MDKKERIKKHWNENKKIYGGVIFGLGVGVLGSIIVSRKIDLSALQVNIKSPGCSIMQTTMERMGHPGFVIQCLETGKKWPSQGCTARDLNLDPGDLSRHLNGKLPHVRGMKFVRLGEATSE